MTAPRRRHEPGPLERALGHVWTVGAHALRRGASSSGGRLWSTVVDDDRRGSIALSGVWHEQASDTAFVLVHGLGGSANSPYMLEATRVALGAGHSVLRLNLRGADRSGVDFYHAGLTADLHAALASPELAAHPRVVVLGFSLGGHVALRLAIEESKVTIGPRVAAVAALCSPLDLAASARHIDRRRSFVYRQHLLRGLREMALASSRHTDFAITAEELARIRSIRDWDDRIVAPRFGFRDAADYYAQMSAGPGLSGVNVPSLIVHCAGDPMIHLAGVLPHTAAVSSAVELRLLAGGGHVAFSPRARVVAGVVDWLKTRARR